ncbi:MAG TPA: hypothetical protein VJX74_16195, partial [Blastocatellia bacterium]|nr:hypothetical protein [Blastocatellia bacterium]
EVSKPDRVKKPTTQKQKRQPHKPELSTEQRQQRQEAAQAKGDDLLDFLNAAIPSHTPFDIREELKQEMALAALNGELDLNDLKNEMRAYRTRVYGNQANRFKHLFIDHPLPGTDTVYFEIVG